jgi:hypothetical protein
MSIHDLLIQDHQTIRTKARALEAALGQGSPKLPELMAQFQATVLPHFKKKDLYYQRLDDGKRVTDRVLMHDLRNDHAAIVFTIESLVIRLRKNGPNEEWKKKWKSLTEVLFPHFDKEESVLFPLGKKLMSPAELQSLDDDVKAL